MTTALEVLTNALIPPPPSPQEVIDGFIPWLREQDPLSTYEYTGECALTKYFKSINLPNARALYNNFTMDFRSTKYHDLPSGWPMILGDLDRPIDWWLPDAREKDLTFGGLLKRLELRQSKET